MAAGLPDIFGGRPLLFAAALRSPGAPVFWLALALAVALNIHVVDHVSAYDDDRLLQLGALATVAILGLFRTPLRHSLASRLADLTITGRFVLAGAAILALLSINRAREPLAGVQELSLLVLLALATTAIAIRPVHSDGDHDLRVAGLVVFAGIGAYEVQFLAGYSAALIANVPLLPRELFPGFATPRFLGQIQTWTLPLTVLPLLLLPAAAPGWRLLLFLVPSLWWTMALASGGRGTLGASILAIVLVAALFRARAGRWLIAYLATAAAGMAIYWLLFMTLAAGDPEPGGAQAGLVRPLTQTSGRVDLWLQALELIRSAPLLGVGPMHYACLNLSGALTAHPHNVLLQLASEWGIPFTLIVVGGATLWAGRWLRWATGPILQDGARATVVVALSASMLAAAAHSMLSGIVVMPLSQVLGMLILGAMLRFRHAGQRTTPGPRSAWTSWLPAGIVLATLLGIGTALPSLVEAYTARLDGDGRPTWLHEPPRFWKAGDICHASGP